MSRRKMFTRGRILLALAITIASVAVPAATHYLNRPSDDALGDMLRSYGFMPIKPPSNLMNVGSLYYVDATAHSFTTICEVAKADVDTSVITSRSWDMQENLERDGRFSTDMKLNLASHLTAGGGGGNDYVQKVHSSLTDIELAELPLGDNWLVFGKIMTRRECSTVAMDYVYLSGYVCQGQKLLQATAEYKLDVDSNSMLATDVKVTPADVKSAVKLAIEAKSRQSLTEREGRLLTGKALQYGVLMNPKCLAPPHTRFARVLPQSTWDRVVNFVLFNILEPMLPAKADETDAAEAPRVAARTQ